MEAIRQMEEKMAEEGKRRQEELDHVLAAKLKVSVCACVCVSELVL